MREYGIIGAGGAGFPSYAKLAEGANLLLINGSECEPLLYTDYVILKNEMSLVLTGISEVLRAISIPSAMLCIKAHTAKRLGLYMIVESEGQEPDGPAEITRCIDWLKING